VTIQKEGNFHTHAKATELWQNGKSIKFFLHFCGGGSTRDSPIEMWRQALESNTENMVLKKTPAEVGLP
jgi:hypothetical protein